MKAATIKLTTKVSLVFLALFLHTGQTSSAPASPQVSEDEVPQAVQAFSKWTEAFMTGDFRSQRALTDPRIVRWYDKRRWRRLMQKSKKNTGNIVTLKIKKAVVLPSEKIPCTEQGHCYRKNVPVVMFLLSTEYTIDNPPQPEYAVMARSEKGWLFGGGTFPNRPMGETLLIMNEKDFKKYTYDPDRDQLR